MVNSKAYSKNQALAVYHVHQRSRQNHNNACDKTHTNRSAHQIRTYKIEVYVDMLIKYMATWLLGPEKETW